MNQSVLNNTEKIISNDPNKMLTSLWKLPEQCEEALTIANNAALPAGFDHAGKILVTGLGGSAIGGDLLRVFMADKMKVPVMVNRDYRLPRYVDPNTLVFAVSYSGNTEETLSAYDQAKKAGAKIIALTSGGKLKAKAEADGFPVITVPGGLSPRAATGYLFIPTVVSLERLGYCLSAVEQLTPMIAHLKELREQYKPESLIENNLAKQMALRCYHKIPIIYGASGTTEVVAMRWKGQINENAKSAAYWNVFPELNHNEIVGLEVPAVILSKLAVVYLRDPEDHIRVQHRMEISKEIITPKVDSLTEVHSSGPTQLARTFSLTYLGDYLSVYLATLYGIDPTPVKMIDFLKNRLAEIK